MRSIKGKELMKLEKWDKRGSRDPDHHEGCMVSRLLGERRNLDRAQIDQKMRSIRREQTLSAVYNTPIIYSGFQIRAPGGKPFSPFNSHPKHMLWVLKRDGPFEHPKHIFNIGEKKNMLWVQKRTISLRRFF